MKKVQNCIVENCIPTPTSCVEWNGGDIEYLGICNGDSLNNVIWEIVGKLEEITGEDLSSFDIDGLLEICSIKNPLEINLISILTLLRDNEICLKDYIDTLNDKINELSTSNNVDVNLKCYNDIDNLGNSLAITREALDQLVIDELCNHKTRIENLEGKYITQQAQIDALPTTSAVEPDISLPVCVDAAPIAPTSSQVVALAEDYCDLKNATGTEENIAIALSRTPASFSTLQYTTIPNWVLVPASWADNYNNLLLAFANLEARVLFMEENCCAISCDDVKVGFTAVMNEDMTGIILRFTNGAGTSIPSGFTDSGSVVTITDIDGNSIESNIVIANNAEEEVITTGLNMSGDLDINITVKMTNGTIQCEKCVFRKITLPGCNFCTLTATGPVTIIYKTCLTT